MKWNWGTKLFIAIVIFMGFIFVLVYMRTRHDVSLVENDYYPKGLKYQDRLEEISTAKQMVRQFTAVQYEDYLEILQGLSHRY